MGESQRVAFKKDVPKRVQLERLLNAFANTEGGILLIGVGDDGTLVGLSENQVGNALARAQSVVKLQFSWPIELGVVDVSGKSVVFAAVDPAPHPLAPVQTSDRRTFFRVGAHVRSPTHDNVRRFYGVLDNAEELENDNTNAKEWERNIVFLSYAREDLAQVQQLYVRLRSAGLEPWMDKPPPPYELEGVPFGQEWDNVIQDRLQKSRVVLALLSQRSVDKMGYVQKEFRSALSNQAMRPAGAVYLIPTLLEDCSPPSYTVENVNFNKLQWYRLHEDGDLTLMRYLQQLTGIHDPLHGRTVAEAFGINVYDLSKKGKKKSS